jgi:hypothetical protein
MIATLAASAVFIVMGAAWWYDHRSLVAEMREMKRIAQGLLDEIKGLREKYGDTSITEP